MAGYLYDLIVIRLMTLLASATLALMTIVTILDVVMRTFGLQPPIWTSTFIEYATLLVTAAMAPVLVRGKGHVAIDALVRVLPRQVARPLAFIVVMVCLAVSAVLAYYAAVVGIDAASRGELDIRSVSVPRWVLFSFLATGFLLCAAEFLRALIIGEVEAESMAESL